MKHLVLFLSFLLPLCLSAQRNFKDGLVVTLKGDTVRGFVDYREWDFTPRSISFKAGSVEGKATEYGVSELQYFEITGKEAYRRGVINISLDPVKLDEVSAKDTSSKTDTVFLKVVQAGPVASLLSYTDRIKERFYLFVQGQENPAELVYREYFTNDSRTSLVKEDRYRFQLRDIMYAKSLYTDKLLARINAANYEEDALRQVILLMNNTGNALPQSGKSAGAAQFRVFAGAGFSRNGIEFVGEHTLAKNPSTASASLMPKVTAGIDLFANPNIGRLFFRLELGVQASQSRIEGGNPITIQYTYELASTSVSLLPQMVYNVYHSDRIKVPVGVGCGYVFSSYSKNRYKEVYSTSRNESIPQDNYFDLRKGYVTLQARAGVIVGDKIEAAFLFQPSTMITSYKVYGIASTVMQVQVAYLFHHKK